MQAPDRNSRRQRNELRPTDCTDGEFERPGGLPSHSGMLFSKPAGLRLARLIEAKDDDRRLRGRGALWDSCLLHCGLPEKQKGPDLGPLAVEVDIANPGFPGDFGFGMFGILPLKTSQEMFVLIDSILSL